MRIGAFLSAADAANGGRAADKAGLLAGACRPGRPRVVASL